MSAEPVLRGTVFDRNFKELAVSYRLYSLYVRPAEITNARDVVRILADVTGQDEAELHDRLNEAKNVISVAEHLEQSQVDLIKNAQLPGLYVKPVEERFYPEHETAASLVGFTGKGIGLAGVEGVFDMLLEEGEFLAETVNGIDFQTEKVLGRKKVDIVLTIDLDLQKQVDRQLKKLLDGNNGSKGAALLMDPKSGAVLAWASQPSFNPNYYWRVPDRQRKSLFEEKLDHDLFAGLLTRVAAIRKKGETGGFLLPETIAGKDYGLTPEEIHQLTGPARNGGDETCTLPSCGKTAADPADRERAEGNDGKSLVELAALVAGLTNGGWKVSPHVLAAVYDHARDTVYERSRPQVDRERVVSPSMGIKIRHDLARAFDEKKDYILVTDTVSGMRKHGKFSEYIMQDALFAAVPAKNPEMMLFIVTEREELNPLPPKKKQNQVRIGDLGGQLLASLYSEEKKSNDDATMIAARTVPAVPDSTNYKQFLISSRIDVREQSGSGIGRVPLMPQLVGLSLRKGLQRLNEYNIHVKVQGSGQIVSQVPAPGEPLQGVGECVLTLTSEI